MNDQTPIERAADALHDLGVKDSWLAAQAVIGSIDTSELADALAKHQPGGPTGGTAGAARVVCSCGHLTLVTTGARDAAQKRAVQHQALAVKDWLTGKASWAEM